MSIFCERCKTYHEPGGSKLCAQPYPSGHEKMILDCMVAIIDALRVQTQYLAAADDATDQMAAEIRWSFEQIRKRMVEGG